jgi:hypothetical protein
MQRPLQLQPATVWVQRARAARAVGRAMKRKPTVGKWFHEDATITITEAGQFMIAGVDDAGYCSLAEARAAIDRRTRQAAATKRRKVSIPAIAVRRYSERNRVNITITGVNAGTGALLTEPPVKTADLYFVTPITEQVLEKARLAHEHEEAMSKQRRKLMVKRLEKPFGEDLDHEAAVAHIEAEYARVQKWATTVKEDE